MKTFEEKFPELKTSPLIRMGSYKTYSEEQVEKHCFSKSWVIKQIKEIKFRAYPQGEPYCSLYNKFNKKIDKLLERLEK